MTGFDSKRQMAKAKLDDDDDTQVHADTLLIVYQRGFADGKRSEQRKPLTAGKILNMMPSNIPAEYDGELITLVRAIEAAHNIKEGT
tara:strand:- start:725 stop:985 length:261 start_codon:yes stop_codon:yes gene_type:complete